MPFARIMDATDDDARHMGHQLIEAYEGQDGAGKFIAGITLKKSMTAQERSIELIKLQNRVEAKGFTVVDGMGKRKRRF